MPNYNKVQLMGNITRDIELRYLPSGMAVAQVGLAINRTWRDRQTNEQREETTFVDCDAFGRTAEVMNEHLGKGRPVFIEGRLKLDQWQDREGNNRSKLKVVVDSFQFIDSRDSRGGNQGSHGRPSSGYSQPQDEREPVTTGGEHEATDEDDIPF